MTLFVNMGEYERLFMCEDKDCPVKRKGCMVVQQRDLSKPILCLHSKNYQCDFHEMNWIQLGNAVLVSHDCTLKAAFDGNYLSLSMKFKNEGDNGNQSGSL